MNTDSYFILSLPTVTCSLSSPFSIFLCFSLHLTSFFQVGCPHQARTIIEAKSTHTSNKEAHVFVLEQWFTHFSVHQNCLKGFLKHKLLGLQFMI